MVSLDLSGAVIFLGAFDVFLFKFHKRVFVSNILLMELFVYFVICYVSCLIKNNNYYKIKLN